MSKIMTLTCRPIRPPCQ